MELLKEQRDLIEKLVKSNIKYSGNEDLLEDFCAEAYRKAYLIIQSVEDINSLENYLKKLTSSAIMDVLKSSGRIVRSGKGYKSVKEIKPSFFQKKSEEPKKEEKPAEFSPYDGIETNSIEFIEENLIFDSSDFQDDDSYEQIKDIDTARRVEKVPAAPDISVSLRDIKDPRESIEEQIIRKDIIENIIEQVKQIDAEMPQENYLRIFYERYFLELKQREIAQHVGVSQAEISKRLVQLSRRIKEKLY